MIADSGLRIHGLGRLGFPSGRRSAIRNPQSVMPQNTVSAPTTTCPSLFVRAPRPRAPVS